MFSAIGRIARAVGDVPVTADIEAGYGLAPDALVRRLVQAGAIGCNLEDTDHGGSGQLRNADEQVERLRAVRRAATASGVNLVLNARLDVFLRLQSEPADEVLDEALRRAQLYADTGADCVFPIGAPDEAAISALVEAVPLPINVIAGFRGAPGLPRLRELGVRRISFAGRLHRAFLQDHQRRLETIRRWEDI